MKPIVLMACGVFCLAIVAGQVRAQLTSSKATFHEPNGKEVGSAALEQTASAVLIDLNLHDLPPGKHAFRVHATGECKGRFDSVGAILLPREAGKEAGDYTLDIPASGKLHKEITAVGATLRDGEQPILDGDGAALVIYQGSLDSDRIACAVLQETTD
jgi:Cu-Zn family superoxide dismutase